MFDLSGDNFIVCHDGHIYKYSVIGDYNREDSHDIIDAQLSKLERGMITNDIQKCSSLKNLLERNIKLEVL